MLSLVQVFQYKKYIGKGSVQLSSESATALRSSELRIQFNKRLFTYQRFMLKASRHRESINAVEGGKVKGSACQGWVSSPTGLQNRSINGGVIRAPLPIKLLSLASPSRHVN